MEKAYVLSGMYLGDFDCFSSEPILLSLSEEKIKNLANFINSYVAKNYKEYLQKDDCCFRDLSLKEDITFTEELKKLIPEQEVGSFIKDLEDCYLFEEMYGEKGPMMIGTMPLI